LWIGSGRAAASIRQQAPDLPMSSDPPATRHSRRIYLNREFTASREQGIHISLPTGGW
jgi:hypothetical protein